MVFANWADEDLMLEQQVFFCPAGLCYNYASGGLMDAARPTSRHLRALVPLP